MILEVIAGYSSDRRPSHLAFFANITGDPISRLVVMHTQTLPLGFSALDLEAPKALCSTRVGERMGPSRLGWLSDSRLIAHGLISLSLAPADNRLSAYRRRASALISTGLSNNRQCSAVVCCL